MKHFIGIGDSHLVALSDAWHELAAERADSVRYTPMCLLEHPYHPSFSDKDGAKIPNPAWVAALQEHLIPGADVHIFLFIGGSEHYRWSLTPGPEPFDVFIPGEDNATKAVGQVIPFDLFMTFAQEKLRGLQLVVEFLRNFTALPLIQILPPPPIRDLAPMVAELPELARQIGEYGVSPLPFRTKIWRATGMALQRTCADLGIESLGAPPGGISDQGCLPDEMVGDVVHANIVWGRLQVQQLLNRAGVVMEVA